MKDGGVSTALTHILKKFAHKITEDPRIVLPDAVQIERHAQKNEEIRQSHAGEVKVGGRAHISAASGH